MSTPRIIPIRPQDARVGGALAAAPAAPPPLSVYVHFPWCVRKCPYCDFNSHAVREGGIPETAYLDALSADLQAALPGVWGRRVISVFIGGGTPSLISAAGLERLLGQIRLLLPMAADAEITLEANPGTIEAAKFADFRAAGVTRVSLGIQSFDDTQLLRLGRIHDSNEACRAIELAARHFDTWNIDLMYALPKQSVDAARSDIETALSFAPPHLSCYHLTLEPNTLFHRAPPAVPDEDTSADMQDMIEERLADAGYQHYETSAFAKPGHRARHNLNYWTFGDYLGLGAGAHGKLSRHDGIVREMRHKHPNAYIDSALRGDFAQERRVVSAQELPFEFMMNALRLIDGVPLAQFNATTGLPLSAIGPGLIEARERGLLHIHDGRMLPTELGRRFLNDLIEIFLDDDATA
jgi:putative oxygen-independent coproporphyrinogen III oxidase